MFKCLLLKAAILSIPLAAAAEPLSLQVSCHGIEENLKVTLEVFYSPDLADITGSIFVVAHEEQDDRKVVRLYDQRDLLVRSIKPLFIKSTTFEPEFFFDMSVSEAEFQGLYLTHAKTTKEDLQIGLACRNFYSSRM